MPGKKEDITLYGERAERFRQIRADLEEYLGYEPTKPEAIGLMMARWDGAEESL